MSVARYAAGGLRRRPAHSLVAALAVGLVVVATSLLAAFAATAHRTLVATADPRNLIVLASGAASEGTSAIAAPRVAALAGIAAGAATGADGPSLSAELVVEASLQRVAPGGDRASPVARASAVAGGARRVLVRGVDEPARRFHERVRLRAGTWPERGANEALLGARLAARLGGVRPGDRLDLGRSEWTVTSVFAAGGTAFEDEVWVDRSDLAADAGRPGVVSVVRVRLADGVGLGTLAERIEADAALGLRASPETSFYERQAHAARVLRGLVALMAVLGGTAACAGLANVVHASVHARRRELGVLRAIGFGRGWVVGTVELESLGAALIGMAFGGAAAAVAAAAMGGAVGGWVASTVGSSAAGAIALELRPADLVPGLLLALGVGVVAGAGPAVRAARLRPAEVLRAG